MATISSEFPGQVVAMNVKAGMKVKAGDAILTLDDPEFELEYERAKVRYEDVQQRWRSRTTGSDPAGNTNAESQEAMRAYNAAKERLAGYSLEPAQRAYDDATAKFDEMQRLASQQLATDAELEQAKRIQDQELRNLRAEREHLSRLEEEVHVAAARVQNTHGFASPSMEVNMDLREAAEALRIASARRDAQKITSTVSGTVIKTMVSVGDLIPSGIPLVQIAQLDQLDFDVPVGAGLARNFQRGDSVTVHVPTEPPTLLPAVISDITLAPSQDNSAYTIRVTVPNPAPSSILAGLGGEVEFRTEAKWPALRF
ncbi:MAG: HlyD family efflux transporter periplasmic adaptor subunit [Acidobacteriaceae bacterium]|nr:HlyD family efflux transporter periplasmic adaptor subunit [Acidobacteriaceae bacterium]